jgi:hypothetical protein
MRRDGLGVGAYFGGVYLMASGGMARTIHEFGVRYGVGVAHTMNPVVG